MSCFRRDGWIESMLQLWRVESTDMQGLRIGALPIFVIISYRHCMVNVWIKAKNHMDEGDYAVMFCDCCTI